MGKDQQQHLCCLKICLGIAWREPNLVDFLVPEGHGQPMEPCWGRAVQCKVGRCHVPVTHILAGHDKSATSAGWLLEDWGRFGPIMPGLLGGVQAQTKPAAAVCRTARQACARCEPLLSQPYWQGSWLTTH